MGEPRSGQNYVTHDELHLELEAAKDAVREDIRETETRLRKEWTDTVRFEVGRVDGHLTDQDTKINWTLGLIALLLITAVGALIYVAMGH